MFAPVIMHAGYVGPASNVHFALAMTAFMLFTPERVLPSFWRTLYGSNQSSCTTHWTFGTAQHSTAQHSTAQHSTAQHSTAQHSTAHPCPDQLIPNKCWRCMLTGRLGVCMQGQRAEGGAGQAELAYKRQQTAARGPANGALSDGHAAGRSI